VSPLQGAFNSAIEKLSFEVGARTRSALAAAGFAVSENNYDIHMQEQAVRGNELVRQFIDPLLDGDDGVGVRFRAQLPFIAAAGYDLGFGIHAFAYHHYGHRQAVARLCSLLNVGISLFDQVCDSGLAATLLPFFSEDTLRALMNEPERANKADFGAGALPRIQLLLSVIRTFFAELHSSSTARRPSEDWDELCQMLVDAYQAEIASVARGAHSVEARELICQVERKSVLPFELMLAIARICESGSGDIEETAGRSLSRHIGKVFALSDDLYDLGRDIQSGDANAILLEAGVGTAPEGQGDFDRSIVERLLNEGHVDRAVHALCSSLEAAIALIDETDDASDEVYRLRERVLCYVRSWTTHERAGRIEAWSGTALTEGEAEGCFKFARRALCERDSLGDASEALPNVAFEMVNLGLYSDGRLRASADGHGPSLSDAIRDASRKALQDERFGPAVCADDLSNARLELWLRHSSTRVLNPHDIDLGLDGVTLKLGSREAACTPSFALTSAIARPEGVLDKLAQDAGFDAEAWKADDAQIWRTGWEHYAERGDARKTPLRLRRLRVADVPPVTRHAVLKSVTLAVTRLMHVQQSSGFFLYSAHPFLRRGESGPTNFVRQAGCSLAMARASELMSDPAIADACFESARRVIDALLENSIGLGNGGRFLVEPGTNAGKLGVTALTLAAMQCGRLADSYRDQRSGLSAAIISLQRSDGSFRCDNAAVSAEADGRAQDYFPGESLMALCRELNGGSPELQAVVEKAFPWYRNYFRRNPTTAFVPWQADAWRLFAEFSGGQPGPGAAEQSKYASFVFEMVDWLQQFQIDDGARTDEMTGGFSTSGSEPGNATASYTEAIVRAYGLASRLGAVRQMERHRRAARLAIGFLFRLQISPETAFLFVEPDGTVGGTTRSLRDMTIRCDYDQHTITALLAALESPGLLDVAN
jgi:hypothetical protein